MVDDEHPALATCECSIDDGMQIKQQFTVSKNTTISLKHQCLCNGTQLKQQFTVSKNMWTEDDAISFSFFTKVCVDACKGLFFTKADEGNCWRWVESQALVTCDHSVDNGTQLKQQSTVSSQKKYEHNLKIWLKCYCSDLELPKMVSKGKSTAALHQFTFLTLWAKWI